MSESGSTSSRDEGGQGQTPSNADWFRRVLGAAAGAVGFSGLLYGAGFLAIRSHYSLLGFWGGIPADHTKVAEEGGRFFFHLCYTPVSLLIATGWKTWAALVVTAAAWDAMRWRLLRSQEASAGKKSRALRSLSLVSATLLLALALAVTVFALETLWQVVAWNDLLLQEPPPQWVVHLKEGGALYSRIVVSAGIAVLLAWGGWRLLWKSGGLLQRVLIIAQALVAIAALGALPVAFGKLMLPAAYPSMTHPSLAPGESAVLIARTEDSWVIWNLKTKRTAVLRQKDDEVVVIGPKQSLLP